jgi:uncharacterized protein
VIEDPVFYVFAILAILVSGIAKSGFGGGLGILAVPIMALAIEPARAAAILLPILCIIDSVNIWHYRKKWDRVNVRILLPAGLLGVLIGAFTFRYLSDAHIRIMIGVIAVVFAINSLRKRGDVPPRGPDVVRGTFWGLIAGFTSFGVHSGGPPANVYLLPQRLDKSVFVGTLVVVFTTLNFVKLIPYALLGQLSVSNMSTSLVLAPLAPVGVWMGIRLHALVNERVFYPLAYVFLLITGIKLLYDGISGL